MLKEKSVLTWCIKCSTPLPFIREKKLKPLELLMPTENHKWEEYLLQLYDNTLTGLLDKQKSSYDTEQSKELKMCNKEVVDVCLAKLKYILTSTSMTQEELSEGLDPCNSSIINILRSGLAKTI